MKLQLPGPAWLAILLALTTCLPATHGQEAKQEKPATTALAAPVSVQWDTLLPAENPARWHLNLVSPHGMIGRCGNCHTNTESWNTALQLYDLPIDGSLSLTPERAAISLGLADETTRAILELPEHAVVVTGVCPSDKEKLGGLAQHDIVLLVNDAQAKAPEVVHRALAATDAVTLTVIRQGKKQELRRKALRKPGQQRYLIGVTLGELEPVVRSQLQLDESVSVFIRELRDDGAAKKAGLQANDILLAVDGEAVTSNEVVQKAVSGSDGEPVSIRFMRAGKKLTIEVKPQLVEVPGPDLESFVANAELSLVPLELPAADADFSRYWYHAVTATQAEKQPVLKKLSEIESKLQEISEVLKALRETHGD